MEEKRREEENKVLYAAYKGKIYELTILKETQKTYKVTGNPTYISTINKNQLDTFIGTHRIVYSHDIDEAVKIFNKGLRYIAEGYMNYAKKLSKDKISNKVTILKYQ